MDKEEKAMRDHEFDPLTPEQAKGIFDMKCKECGEVQHIMEFDLPHFCKTCRGIDTMEELE
jgi:uncharacterized OB-fold protein